MKDISQARADYRANYLAELALIEAALAAIASGEREDDTILVFDNGLAVAVVDGKLKEGFFFNALTAPAISPLSIHWVRDRGWTVRNGNGEKAQLRPRSLALRDEIARFGKTLEWLDGL